MDKTMTEQKTETEVQPRLEDSFGGTVEKTFLKM